MENEEVVVFVPHEGCLMTLEEAYEKLTTGQWSLEVFAEYVERCRADAKREVE